MLGLGASVVESVYVDEGADAVIVAARPRKGAARRCPWCARRCALADRGEGRRRWRAVDLGEMKAFVEADAPRVSCPQHGVVVAAVPWARHSVGTPAVLMI